MAPPETVFLSTSPGLEGALLEEASLLGAARAVPGGVELSGAQGLHQVACLRLRIANQVLLRVAELPLEGDLRRTLAAVELSPFGPVSLEATGRGVVAPQKLLAEARARWGHREEGARVVLRVDGARLTVSADCAGELLFRRGYRQEVSRAPMRETIAAGILRLGGYAGSRPLFDPMCGSGTLVIEGDWIARRRAPGALRSFAFETWRSFDPERWQRLKREAAAEERPPPASLQGADLNAGSLGVARRNARRAGASGIQWVRQDALRAEAPAERGVLVTNLPYGKRVGGEGDPVALHRQFGEVLRARYRGWTALLFTSEELAPELRLDAADTWPVDNGGLRCRLMKIPLP